MEIGVHPRGFSVQPAVIPTPTGPVEGMRFTIVDQTGIVVHATFGLQDWEQFQKFIADPDGETAKASARAKIVAPNGLSPTVKDRRH